MTHSEHILYRALYVTLTLIGAILFWSLCTSIFTGINKSWLHFVFPAVLLTILLVDYLPMRKAARVWIFLALVTGASITFWIVRSEFLAVGFALLVFVLLLRVLSNVYETKPRILFLRASAVFLGSCVALLIAEVACRTIVKNEYHRIPEGSESVFSTHYLRMGVKPEWVKYTRTANQASSILVAESKEYKNAIEFNAKGLRGPLVDYEKRDSTYRIMLLGDSYVEAVQVPYEQTLQVQLANRIKERGLLQDKKIEVFGVGTSMWGTINEYMYYRHEGYRYKPDLVLLIFIPNDVQNNMPANTVPGTERSGRNRRMGGEFILQKDDVVLTDYQEDIIDILRLATQRTLEGIPLAVKNNSSLWWALYNVVAHPFIVDAVKTNEGMVVMPQEAWDRTASIVRILKEAVDESGAHLVIASMLSPRQNITGIDDDKDGQVRHMKEITTELNIPWLNLKPLYENYVKAGHSAHADLFGIIDHHWSANGHRVTSEFLLDWLTRDNLLTKQTERASNIEKK